MSRSHRARTALAAVLGAALLPLAACTHSGGRPQPAPLTGQQAEALALTRFTNYRAGTAHVTATVPLPGSRVVLDARLDWRAHTGYGLLRDATPGAARHWQHLLRWDRTTVAAHFDWPGKAPAKPPADGWSPERPLDPHTSTVDTALALLLGLAADRPDNAQLLVRSGAARIGAATVGGRPVTEYAGPSAPGAPSSTGPGTPSAAAGGRTRYWIDSAGLLRRFAARLPGSPGWTTADLTAPYPAADPAGAAAATG
ncbi:hypothetical protein [Streptomyces sp. NPDC021020]|uniref:hypothetical protein n=1 Tax=Streptomyces sp. NPDC021020 TaxID=3365109 RepID=UPI0037ACB641